MSKSRSTTPTPTPNTPVNSSSNLPISRLYTHENIHSIHASQAGEREHHISRSAPIHSLRSSLPEPSTSGPSQQFSHTPSRSMARRLRRQSSAERSKDEQPSSPSSDSQGGLADTEMDGSQSQQSEASAPPVAPPKKKRTRTLTTPHQSAVLHALLAQSRFPTTAMREEVGRSIGLSARKVQIWFQNQRQKARRPRSSSQTPATAEHLAQFGPFPSAPAPTSHLHDEISERALSPLVSDPRFDDVHAFGGQRSMRPSETGAIASSSRLQGPGMPGPSSGFSSGSRDYLLQPTIASSSQAPSPGTSRHHPYPELQPRPSPSPPYGYRTRISRPSTAHTIGSMRPHDPSRTLPPLFFDQPSRGNVPGPIPRSIQPSFTPTYSSVGAFDYSRPSSSGSPFAHQPPDLSMRSTLAIPPPFTLQPQPRWGATGSSHRPQSSPWNNPGSQPSGFNQYSSPQGRSREVVVAQPHPGQDDDRALQTETHARLRRYDPVRAAFISYAPPSAPHASSSAQIIEEDPDHGAGNEGK